MARTAPRSTRVSLHSLAHGFAQFAALMRAGLPLAPALTILAQQAQAPPWRRLLYRVRAEVETGVPLSQAFSRYHPHVPRWIGALLRAGEAAGTLEVVLEQIAEQLARTLALHGKMRAALSYPLVVLLVALFVTGFLIAVVVPQFASILTQLGGELPAATRALLGFSRLLREGGWWLLGALLGVAGLLARGLRSPRGRAVAERLSARVPWLGGLQRARAVATFARTSAMLLRAGVPVSDALTISQGVVGFAPLEVVIHEARLGVTRGEPLSRRFRRHPHVIPALVVSMLAVGEETGNLPEMLARLAQLYEREVDDALAALAATLEPLLVLGLGAVVAWVVAAMAGPMMALVGVLG